MTLTSSVRLDPSCTWTGGFDITASHVTLDCQDALVQHVPGGPNLGIVVQTPADVDLAGVTIRRCRVDGFLNNVHLVRQGFQHLTAGHEYDHHLQGVVIERSTLTNSRGVGIYVNGYVTDATLRDLVITGSGSTGIYLDTGSRHTIVTRNVLVGNGFKENGPGGTNTNFNGLDVRFWGPGREAIAVDGSLDNVIFGNYLVGNSAGGVFLYTNCGENVQTDPGSWVEHRYGAEHNLVASNLIVGGEEGVWVGARMGENVYPMDCSDVPYVSGSLFAITLDRAAHNTIRGNVVSDVTFGVRVEDDDTTVASNAFHGDDPSHYAVVVGTPYRTTALGRPVTNVRVRGNHSEIVGNTSPYRWVDGVLVFRTVDNTALGRASRFCAAPDIPRGPFVMTYAFAPQDPTQPPVDPPPYNTPTLGVLPACSGR